MAENVLGTLFGEIADAIREKTGDTATMKPAEFPEKISGIETGGGSVEGVHFITFMSEDGTAELYKRPVADGDDCADPVERGYISEPTKESTAQYNYTHVGWSATANGALDENILKAVTADKTVYANFAAVLRYYTITYYDSDGTTVLKTESLAYGATPTYEPTKDGYKFTGWTPALATVTGNASYVASFEEILETITDDWATISSYALAGTASEHYQVGDTKLVEMTFSDGTTVSIPFAIAGFSLHKNEDGTKDGITFIQCKNIGKKVYMGENGSGYDSSIYPYIAEETKSVIRKSTIDYKFETSTGGNTISDLVTKRYLFGPEYPNLSKNSTAYYPSGSSLTYYSTESTPFPLLASKTLAETAEYLGFSGTNTYWTRSAYLDSNSTYYGKTISMQKDDTYGIVCYRLYCGSGGSRTYPLICFRV